VSYKRKGQLTLYGEWSKHIKKIGKKYFWKGERKAEKRLVKEETSNL